MSVTTGVIILFPNIQHLKKNNFQLILSFYDLLLEVKIVHLIVAVGVCLFVPTLVILIARPIEVATEQLDDVLVSGALLPSSHLVLFFKFDSSISSF